MITAHIYAKKCGVSVCMYIYTETKFGVSICMLFPFRALLKCNLKNTLICLMHPEWQQRYTDGVGAGY